MGVDKDIIPGLLNGTRVYSPLTLNSEWSSLGRLAFMVFAACFGTTFNSYFIASFFVEKELRKTWFVYLGCCGLADMLITGGIVPIAAVALLSGVWDVFPVCQFVQFLASASTYCYSIIFALLAGEICYRVGISDDKAERISQAHKPYVIVTVFLFSMTLAGVGTYMRLDYDYCQRRFYGDFYFRIATTVFIHGFCFIFTMVSFIISHFRIEQLNRLRIQYQLIKIKLYLNMTWLNISAYLLYVACWIPYLIIVYRYPNIEDKNYYICAWVGIGRTLVTNFAFGFMNANFSKAYGKICLYCCCKYSLYNYNTPRSRRTAGYCNNARSGGINSVNIHILQAAVNPHSPQRASTSARDREALEL